MGKGQIWWCGVDVETSFRIPVGEICDGGHTVKLERGRGLEKLCLICRVDM